MKKSIIAIVVATVSFASVSASANVDRDLVNNARAYAASIHGSNADRAVMIDSLVAQYESNPNSNNGMGADLRGMIGDYKAPVIELSGRAPVVAAQVQGVESKGATDSEHPESKPVATAQQAASVQHNQPVLDVERPHLDSNATEADRIAAQVQANVKNGVDGKDGVNGEAGKAGVNGSNGIDGKAGRDGNNGKDGVTTVRHELDTQTKAVVLSHSRAISNNSAAIERNSQRIDRNAKAIADNTKAIKHVGAMAAASANLHYNVNHSGYAVAAGEYKGSTAFAGGVQVQTSATTAITFQASYDGESVGASVGFHGDF